MKTTVLRKHVCPIILLCLFVLPVRAQPTTSLTGRVVDADDGQPLGDATVVVHRAGTGDLVASAITGEDGRYRVQHTATGRHIVAVSFVGYREARRTVTFSAGEARSLDVALDPIRVSMDDIVVTASRQQEKVLDAPASISVLSAEEVTRTATPSTVDVLRNTTGVDMATTGVNRRELVLRGFNNAFSGATYVMTDYRHAAVPSLAVNLHGLMPTQAVDIETVEVVRGPGSALYGAGVDAGVIHFITKSPFDHPGTTLSITGGQRALFNGQLRHAGVLGERLGYKITGGYTRADDWELDPDDPDDAGELRDEIVARNYDTESYNVNGLLQYRLPGEVTLSVNGGYSRFTGTVLSGIGTLLGDGFGYTYGQFRLQAGDFFAQAYVNRNDAGNSTVYGTNDRVVDDGMLYTTQAQYDLSLAGGRQQFIVGLDASFTRPDTDGSILGRNEADDDINELGAYLQSTTALTSRLDLTLALRGDYNNVVDGTQLSPRAALVFKPAPAHSLRASFNRAFSSPTTNSNFLDIVAGHIPGTDIAVRARGAAYGYTFERNAAYGTLFGNDLVAHSLNPATLGQPQPAGLPLGNVYAALYGVLSHFPVPDLTRILRDQGWPVNEEMVASLVHLLGPEGGTAVEGFSAGRLAQLNPNTGAFTPVSGVTDVAPLRQQTTQTFEVGYKGVFGSRFMVAADAYYAQREHFIGPLTMETPFVLVPTLTADLESAISGGIGNNAPLAGALAQLGVTPEMTAQLLLQLAGNRLPDAQTPVAIVQPRENATGAGRTPELLMTYRNFGRVRFWGVDLSTQLLVGDALSVFGNLSLVSDDFFDNEELDETDTNLAVALNAPTLKVQTGFDYTLPGGLSLRSSARYIEGFPVRSGPYVGTVDDYFLLDVGAGYDLDRLTPGLRFDVLIQNVLDNAHREFVGAPRIGRLALARLTYSL